MLVALLTTATGFGAVYYLVKVYNIEFTWLNVEGAKWGVDSWKFFTEMYPLAAAVLLISLLAYFMIVSSVRGYKSYLSSGQDYRKMVSLADSIDDLTNPTQIARLSKFPELQSVLRNYGDQIREISEEMSQKEKETNSVDLEMEIDSLIKGNPLQETLAEGKWWAPLARKVSEALSAKKEEVNEAGKQAETLRRSAARTALSFGRAAETLGAAGEDAAEIARAVAGLDCVMKEISGAAPAEVRAETNAAHGAPAGEMKPLLDALKDSGRKLFEFSEENNGLALNMALMAARGNFNEHDLAQFAEAVRKTAERFNKLGARMADVTDRISENLRSGRVDTRSGGASFDNSGIIKSLSAISKTMETRSRRLQEKIKSLEKELEAVDGGLHGAMAPGREAGAETDSGRRPLGDGAAEGGGRAFVNFGDGVENRAKESGKDDVLVLDRSNLWQAPDAAAEEAPVDRPRRSRTVEVDIEPAAEPAGPAEKKAEAASEQPDESAALSDRLREVLASVEREEQAEAAARGGEGWMDMPGNNWVKAGREERQPAPEPRPQRAPSGKKGADDPMIIADELFGVPGDRQDGESPRGLDKHVESRPAKTAGLRVESGPADASGDEMNGDDDPVYDLLELGAVEYQQKTSAGE